MAYTAWSVSFGEQPSASKWNQLGSNDAHFYSFLGDNTAWQTWSPSYANITVGDGTVTARYNQVGKRVRAEWMLVCGSTTSIATNNTISLPVTGNARYGTSNMKMPIGLATFNDINGSLYPGYATIDSTTTILPRWVSTTTLTGTFPATEATGDIYTISVEYEAA